MKPSEFWDVYAGGFTPLTFMRLFHCENPAACAAAYVSERPALYGIVRRGSWRETFAASVQHTRLEVSTALAAYLEETQGEWRAELEVLLAADAAAPQAIAPPESDEMEAPAEEDASDAQMEMPDSPEAELDTMAEAEPGPSA